jgi:uncharacterized protein (DUF427 family)
MESVWSYPTTPTAVAEPRIVRVEFGGIVVAESKRAIRLLERGLPPSYYVPPEHTRTDLLVPSQHRSLCPVKGTASYWGIRVGDQAAAHVAWSYAEPFASCEAVRNYFAFYVGQVGRCTVGDDVARANPHAYYGGWILPDIEGPFVGDDDLPDEYRRLLERAVLDGRGKKFEEIAADSQRIGRRYLPD